VSALSAVQSAIVRLFRADMAVAAGLPEDPTPLAETLARLDEMHARVQDMIAAAPPPADPRAAAEQAIAEALRRERMAPDDYAPMPDAPEPLESDDE